MGLLSPEDAAAMLGIKVDRLYELARRQIVPAVRLGRSVKFDPAALSKFIEKGGMALPGGWRWNPE